MAKPISDAGGDLGVIERLCGGIDTRPGHCELHGDFVDVLYRRRSADGNSESHGWGGCPECAKSRLEERREDDEQNRLAEVARDRINHYQGHAGIWPKFEHARFENYRPVNEKAARHLATIQEYGRIISGRDHGGRCLILTGNVGAGKTHLCCALLRMVINETAQPCFYINFDELITSFRETFDRDSGVKERDLLQRFSKYRLLVIDEVGMQSFSDFELTVAYKVINARYLQNLPTVLGTNMPANNLKKGIGERAVDRMRENGGRALEFDWMSYRERRCAA
ncbi:ATP-binding protein [Marinobacter sp. JSM 1782161]|uniref:ATP-binding protein n=1 Tax=Marinobacter sp. JSM 1782161 TaxID=2685906 RepID=UPI0014027056|nr:ATP-binding protein [Marinobacter sp. JSM 1782161]